MSGGIIALGIGAGGLMPFITSGLGGPSVPVAAPKYPGNKMHVLFRDKRAFAVRADKRAPVEFVDKRNIIIGVDE